MKKTLSKPINISPLKKIKAQKADSLEIQPLSNKEQDKLSKSLKYDVKENMRRTIKSKPASPFGSNENESSMISFNKKQSPIGVRAKSD